MLRTYIALSVFCVLGIVEPATAFERAPAAPQPAVAPPSSAGTQAIPDLERALRQLMASSAVWKENDADYRRQRAAGKLSGPEAEDYASYVAELKREVLVDCDRVRRTGGGGDLKKYGCPELRPQRAGGAGDTAKQAGGGADAAKRSASPGSLPESPEAVKTEGETAASLDDALRRVESDLDEMTRRTEQDARQRSASLGAGGAAGGNSGAGGGANGQAGQSGVNGKKGGEGAQAGAESARKNNGQKQARTGEAGGAASAGAGSPSRSSSRGAQGAGQQEEAGAMPGTARPKERTAKADDSPGVSGTDDDVVARQLREAAEQEPDPELKKKLWVEYRKYKEAQH